MNQRPYLLIALLLSCSDQAVEICDDSADNDLDGLIDCADNNCLALPSCIEIVIDPEDCATLGDEDGNALSDCEDPGCVDHPFCNPESICGDVIDNDGDGATDCFDEDCADSSICNSETCGDNFVDPGEECDGDNLVGLGCESFGFGGGALFCTNECFVDTSSCTIFDSCGDGSLNSNEGCDDGNQIDLDGCSALCQVEEFITETEPNEDGTPKPNGNSTKGNNFDVFGVAAQNALNNGLISSNTDIVASLSPSGDEDVFAVTNSTQADVLFSAKTFGEATLSFCDEIDTFINIRNQSGEIIRSNDNSGPDLCSQITNVQLAPGEIVFVHVLAFGDVEESPLYFLKIRFP